MSDNSVTDRINTILLAVLITGLLGLSGFPRFHDSKVLMITFMVFALFCAVYFKVRLQEYVLPSLLFISLQIIHLFYYGTFYFNTLVLNLIAILYGIISVTILKKSFVEVFLKAMTVFTVISLLLFLPILLYPPFADWMINYFPIHYTIDFNTNREYGDLEVFAHCFFFLTFPNDFSYLTRNAGPFWEPAVFGGYLVLSLMLSTFRDKTVFNARGFIFLVAIITTFSTTTYIAAFSFLGLYYLIRINNLILVMFFLIAFAILFVVSYNKIEFLGKKIEYEMSQIDFDAQLQGGNSRMASAYLDLKEISESPFHLIFGRGSHPETRVASKNKDVQRNNGITRHLTLWGLPLFLVYFYLMRRSWREICKWYGEKTVYANLAIIILMIIAFSEVLFIMSVMWSLVFLYIPYGEDRKEEWAS